MQKPELIKNYEAELFQAEEQNAEKATLTKEAVDELFEYRYSKLAMIKSLISLKVYHQISEKLEKERQALAKFLHWEDTKQDILANYSFVLDSHYFEQSFLGEEH